jgi:hypothetical protein
MRKEVIGRRVVAQFACICGARSEGEGDPPDCWSCDREMYQWGTRVAEGQSTVLTGERADTRTSNGGY